MFNAPEIFTNIPEIAHIYELNNKQSNELEQALERLDNNIFLDRMDAETCERWEKILEITAFDNDTLKDRRFRIKLKVLEKLPYSYRVIVKKLDNICQDGYVFVIDDKKLSAEVKLSLKSKKMITDVDKMLDNTIPLNMTYVVSIIWNMHEVLGKYTHGSLGTLTHQEMREKVLE